MKKFVGIFHAKLDDKGRLVFPSAFKSAMEGEPLHFIVKKDPFVPCLTIYTDAEWDRKSEYVRSKLNFYKPDHNRLWRLFMSNRAAIEPDPKLGRIAIPKTLLDLIQVKKEVVFFGQDNQIELWPEELINQAQSDTNEEAVLTESILGED